MTTITPQGHPSRTMGEDDGSQTKGAREIYTGRAMSASSCS